MPLLARETGLEPATSGVTGRRSNQLSYSRSKATAFRLGSLRRQGRPELNDAPNNHMIKFWEMTDGGARDGARTRDLRRDRPAL